MNACSEYDVIPVMPIFALFRNMMWVKTGRAQWVLIEEGAGDGCGLVYMMLILVLFFKKIENVPEMIEPRDNRFAKFTRTDIRIIKKGGSYGTD